MYNYIQNSNPDMQMFNADLFSCWHFTFAILLYNNTIRRFYLTRDVFRLCDSLKKNFILVF